MTASLLQSIIPKFMLPEDCYHYLSINRIIKKSFLFYYSSFIIHFNLIFKIYSPTGAPNRPKLVALDALVELVLENRVFCHVERCFLR